MSRDSKLGLVIGVGLVLTIAVTFFRKDQATATPSSTTSVSTIKAPAPADPPSPPPGPMPYVAEPPPLPEK
jgi:hypothetical protein